MKREARKTRGKRITELEDDAQEFYAHDNWKDSSDDDDIISEDFDSSEVEDVEDSDIDALDEKKDEEIRNKQAVAEEKELSKRKRTTKSHIPTQPKPKRPKKPVENKKAKKATGTKIKNERKLRRTTQEKSQETEVIAKNAAKKKTKKSNKTEKRKAKYFQLLTQRDYLLEAAKTERDNQRQLIAMMVLQEHEEQAMKKKYDKSKSDRFKACRKEDIGVYHSDKHGTTYSFGSEEVIRESLNFDSFVTEREFKKYLEKEQEEDELKQSVKKRTKKKYSKVQRRKEEETEKRLKLEKEKLRPKCEITGLPAKYRDPKSGKYYATLDAFKKIRELCK